MIQQAVSEISTSDDRSDLLYGRTWLLGTVASLIVYAITVCPDVLMMDYGEYQRATWLFPHVELPQGSLVRAHINYLMTAKLFGLLVPVGQWALRINLFSAVAGSIAVGNVCTLTLAMTRRKRAVILAWLVLTLGQITWLYSVITHSASLQAAAISAEMLMLYLWATSNKLRWLVALWAINGFAAGIHMQNALATPIYLAMLLIAWRQASVNLKQIALCLGVWLVGFSPYMIFCILHWMAGTAGSSTLASMTVGKWGGQMGQLNPKVWLKGLLAIPLNYPTGLWLLCIPGIAALIRSSLPGRLKWTWLAIIAANVLFGATYNIADQQRYFVLVFAAATPLIALGAQAILKTRLSWAAAFALALLVIPVYAILPTIMQQPAIAARLPLPKANALPHRSPYDFYLVPWKTGWHNDRQYLEETWQDLPPDTLYICRSTIYDGLKTLQIVESERTDVILNPSAGMLADNLETSSGTPSLWRKPVYSWSATESGVPLPVMHFCQFSAKGIVYEVRPPENVEGFVKEMAPLGTAR